MVVTSAASMSDAPMANPTVSADRDGQHGDQASQVVATDVLEHVESNRSMLDLLGSVPAHEVKHGGIGADGIELGRVVEDPVPEHRREVLDRRDGRQARDEPGLAEWARRIAPKWRGTPEVLAHPLGPGHDPVGLEPVAGQVLATGFMGPRMGGLLPHEALHIGSELLVVDERKGFSVDVAEPALARREHDVQHVHHVRRHRIARHPLPRRLAQVEPGSARSQRRVGP